ncbi:uncharacterized protein ACN427_010745 [Glossina fuscipes fuscipes]
MRTSFFKFRFILSLISYINLVNSLPIKKPLQVPLTSNYIRAIAAYKKLEPYLSQHELRTITILGIVNGIKDVEKQMEEHLINQLNDFLSNTDMSDRKIVLPRIEKIEQQLQRDRNALEILVNSMDLAMKNKHVKTYKKELHDMLRSVRRENRTFNENIEISDLIGNLRTNILKQIDMMKNVVDTKVNRTVDYLIKNANINDIIARAGKLQIKKRNTEIDEPARIEMIKTISSEDDVRKNLIDITDDEKANHNANYKRAEDFYDNYQTAANNVIKTSRRSNRKNNVNPNAPIELVNAGTNDTNIIDANNKTHAKQEIADSGELDDDDFDIGEGEPAAGGGIVGLISSLSGGEGGSDIGALIGALTGVISNIFGPGGLDIESLISTATALISGLLAGNKNFGTVLGEYVGTAFDGLSGGGGAINNGQFVGNFLGTVVASLSADPEEDDVPPRPFIFLKNLISSFIEAKNRKESDEDDSEERKDTRKEDNKDQWKGGSDSAAFIKHIVAHLVSGVVSIILNASVGASGGASQASQSIFTGSSGHKPAAVDGNGW